ncbi:hypothetical protein SCP_0113420 [Sparassis crispa]|uniref:Uncharacterized protein n=1 Tax=Sparassis crispa TaxID=139825 RepID=A0A401G8J0_9APHY|nr:hypothetical protein SCP_0113420 [Sparassis crispa]GBE78453.1 hypothetical protein SCP_0113420 [Sparassis crispa]
MAHLAAFDVHTKDDVLERRVHYRGEYVNRRGMFDAFKLKIKPEYVIIVVVLLVFLLFLTVVLVVALGILLCLYSQRESRAESKRTHYTNGIWTEGSRQILY